MKKELVTLRVEQGYTVNQIAKLLGITPTYYTYIETGRRNPSYNFLCKFKNVFPNETIDSYFF